MTTEKASEPSRARRKRGIFWGLALLVLTTLAAIAIWLKPRPAEDLLPKARAAFAQGDFRRARILADQLLKARPNSPGALLIKARAAFQLGYCNEAEQALRGILVLDPENRAAHKELVRILKMEGRFRDLAPHALALFRSGDLGSEFLMPLAAPDDLELSDVELGMAEHCRTAVPDDPLPLLGVARHLLNQNELKQAREILFQIVKKAPERIEAQVQLGTALFELNDSAGFVKWHYELPAAAEQHPNIWYLRGMFAGSNEQPKIAVRCFWEAVRRDPNHRQAIYQLSQRLSITGDPEQTKPFADRFALLEEVSRLVTKGDDASGSRMSPETMLRIAELMKALGRNWEAFGWREHAEKNQSRSADGDQSRPAAETPLTLASANLARSVDFSHYPLPGWVPEKNDSIVRDNSPAASSVAFEDVAAKAELNFRYYNGADPASGLARMFEFSGGGVAVLDYDGDGWPDLYLTQGCSWPPGTGQALYQDKLFRNVEGRRFEDVTAQSGLGDDGYSQGAAVGDFNNDGFADLFLANIGANRLYLNLGDGTFEDLTIASGIRGDEWTASCLLADLNQDSLPDVYCVNYLGGSDVYTRRCERNGVPIQCPLHVFPSAQDRVFVNLGDGRFEDVTDQWGVVQPNGKGLGIVAADFAGQGRLNLFIANDSTPNFLLVPDEDSTPAQFSYVNRGVTSGLAFGDFGTAQSCMGVAAGDANNDGLLDLYVTNFTNEHNNLYLQQPGLVFADQAHTAGLHWATMREMGWGAQFLDGELDGRLDLIVANGHLDENTSGRFPYKMPAQYFRNLGENRFQQASALSLGPYFQRVFAGRAIARLDWNRDGLEDCCITHVDDPAALLSNQTTKAGNRLVLRLCGIHSSRDAIGSIVRVKAGNNTIVRHLTAGDGYQASNERKLTCGIGPLDHIEEVEIRWPSGTVQRLLAPELNQEILVIEGRSPIELREIRNTE